ncbi:MAG TPA: Gfo/Idh/MocA family oxidoreductase [Myxococcaceae bacterium]|nr:Gfo/Idh/MocA family oxidoreductase [Myxococcaceae bacterium]
MASGRRIGFAVVGLGHISQAAVLPAFSHAKKTAFLAALVSGDGRKREELSEHYGVPAFGYGDFDECLRLPEVEAVYIALPNSQHAEYAIRAARAGAHVLVEKPMATSEADCRRMIGACEDAGVLLMVAYRLHFDEANLRAIQAIRERDVGEPRLFTSTFTMQVRGRNVRLEKEKGGGVLWDIGLYCVNAARYLFGAEPTEVTAFADRSSDSRFAEVEESLTCSMRFPGGQLATFACSFGASDISWFEVVGTDGRVRLTNAYDYQGEHVLERWRGHRHFQRVLPPRDQFGPELAVFSDCALHGKSPEPDGWEGLADVRIVEALYRSAREGRAVALEPLPIRARPTLEQVFRQPPVRAPHLVDAHQPTRD